MMNDKEQTTIPNVSMHANPDLHSSLADEDAGNENTYPDTDITAEELQLLDDANVAKDDDVEQARARLDDTDDDGEQLNKTVDESGEDLDVPGAELEDAAEATGAEDEENNNYSLPKQNETENIF